MWTFLYKLASPRTFYKLSHRISVVFGCVSLLCFAYGLYGGLVLAPPDHQQGDAFRIIYIHVPSAFMSLFVYSFMAFLAVLVLVWRFKLAEVMLKVSTSLGAWFTLIALFTGSVWGKPMWGTWWIWDARLTSELVLLFLYLGIIALMLAVSDPVKAARAAAVLVLVGLIDIPLIHYSVVWWNTLHQGATLSRFAKPAIASNMLYPLLAMIVAFASYFISIVLIRARAEVLLREYQSAWVRKLLLV